MKLSAILLGLFALVSGASVRNYDANDYYVLELDSSTSPGRIADRLGLRHEGALGGGLDGHHIFSARKEPRDVVKPVLRERRLRKRSLGDSDLLDGVRLALKQELRKPMEKRLPPYGPRNFVRENRADAPPDPQLLAKQQKIMRDLQIADPIFNEQWHLLNTVQPGHDVNVTGVWTQGITGKNATVAIVDDGLDMDSDDLKPNYYAAGSYDFNDHREAPKPMLSDDRHGTRCAGEVSAARNNVCGVGVAYESRIAGIRILSKLITDADEAVAMTYDYQHNDIYSCSWGPPDDGRSMDAPGLLIRRAMLKGIQQGRAGKGSIYVFASGNGAANDDNCNFDGYTNSIYSITVGAIDRKGQHPYYSEKCSAQMVVTYSSGSGDAIHTTDVGQNECYDGHGGTSAAAPLGAGVYALVLEVRPDLTWRDMQWLAMDTAVPINDLDGDWQTTKIGKKFSHTYGYGKIDAYAIIEAAKKWKNVKPQAWYYSPWIHVNKGIPQGKDGISIPFEVTADALKQANLERVEHVTVTTNVNHTRRGDLSVDLISPEGIVSHLSVTRKMDSASTGYVDWTFMSVAHWGESGVGKWTLIVRDTEVNEHNGTFVDWHLKLWGEAIDGSRVKLLPMPTEEDDNDHALIATTTVSAAPGPATPPPGSTDDKPPVAVPSDHPNRPTKVKPSGGAGTPTETGAATGTQGAAASTTSPSNWVSWLPSFGKAGVWVYGAIGLIAVFCSALGIWFYIRKRRNSTPRDNYEFELLNEDETEGLNGEKRTRGRELYDAFAGDDEDEDDSGEYHDRERERSGDRRGNRETDRLTEK